MEEIYIFHSNYSFVISDIRVNTYLLSNVKLTAIYFFHFCSGGYEYIFVYNIMYNDLLGLTIFMFKILKQKYTIKIFLLHFGKYIKIIHTYEWQVCYIQNNLHMPVNVLVIPVVFKYQ